MKFIELISDWLIQIKDTPCEYFVRDVLGNFEHWYNEEVIIDVAMFVFKSDPRLYIDIRGGLLGLYYNNIHCMTLYWNHCWINGGWLLDDILNCKKEFYSFLPVVKHSSVQIALDSVKCEHCGVYSSDNDMITDCCCGDILQ